MFRYLPSMRKLMIFTLSMQQKLIKLDHLVDKARKFSDSSPPQVKSFPWNRAFDNFIQLVLDLVLAVVKYLSVPLLAVSSLSEMSYCAHKRKLFLVPIPLIIGLAVAGYAMNYFAMEGLKMIGPYDEIPKF
ncbi:hypothetical protein UlMin_033038 [Ulmus minor]